MDTHKERIFGLDVVRALAIILILCSHTTLLLYPESNSLAIKSIQFFGTIGVDIFFVLSGFLIGKILIKHIESKKTKPKDIFYFWVRRWFRTLPNYFLILLINILLFYWINHAISEHIGCYFLFLHNFSGPQPDFFTESWSLSIEEFAYIIGPLVLLLLAFLRKKINKWTFLIMTLAIILIVIINRLYFNYNSTNLAENSTWSKSLRKVVVYRLDSIYYGFIGAFFSFYYQEFWKQYKKLFFILGASIFILIHWYIFVNQLEPTITSFFFNVIYLTIIPISILFTFPVFSLWLHGHYFAAAITKISVWSYSIYLINYSILLLSIQHVLDVKLLSSIEKGLLLVLFWALTFFFSYLLYSKYERPMTKLRESTRIKTWFS